MWRTRWDCPGANGAVPAERFGRHEAGNASPGEISGPREDGTVCTVGVSPDESARGGRP